MELNFNGRNGKRFSFTVLYEEEIKGENVYHVGNVTVDISGYVKGTLYPDLTFQERREKAKDLIKFEQLEETPVVNLSYFIKDNTIKEMVHLMAERIISILSLQIRVGEFPIPNGMMTTVSYLKGNEEEICKYLIPLIAESVAASEFKTKKKEKEKEDVEETIEEDLLDAENAESVDFEEDDELEKLMKKTKVERMEDL